MIGTTGRALLGALVFLYLALPAAAQAPSRTVILSTTTSTQDSGLLDVLVPLFEKKTGYTVKAISVGTGQALALAARGEADVTLAHAPSLEKKYVEEGKMQHRRLVMYNDFIIIGPEADPAGIKGEKSAIAALKKIAGLKELEAEARDLERVASESPMNGQDGWDADLREIRLALDKLGAEPSRKGAATL